MLMIVCCVTMQCAVYITESNVYTAEITMNATVPKNTYLVHTELSIVLHVHQSYWCCTQLLAFRGCIGCTSSLSCLMET